MKEEEYLSQRLDDQIKWYDKRSTEYQICFKSLKIIEIILSSSITVAVSFMEGPLFLKLFIGVSSAFISIITAIHGIYNFQENWVKYRNTCEALKHEKFLYFTKTGVYSEADNPFKLLVERCENIMLSEHTDWVERQTRQKQNLKETNYLSSIGS